MWFKTAEGNYINSDKLSSLYVDQDYNELWRVRTDNGLNVSKAFATHTEAKEALEYFANQHLPYMDGDKDFWAKAEWRNTPKINTCFEGYDSQTENN